jgi:peptidoglycan/xylan/chitin deacetylase (PgdA/CDA1 family)
MRMRVYANSRSAAGDRGAGVVRRAMPAGRVVDPVGNRARHEQRREQASAGLGTPGRALDPPLRALFEQRFGRSFAGVRVHTGADASLSADALGASAYTVGRDIAFGRGRYRPGSVTGRGLLAHELAHVAQQDAGSSPTLEAGEADRGLERQADTMAGAAARGATVPAPRPAAAQVMCASRKFSLTFDDGPHAAPLGEGKNLTERVLDTLKARNIRAAFFVQTGVSYRMANRVGRALVARMQAEGHTVGIHTGGTADHELHTEAQAAGRLEGELTAGKAAVEKVTGTAPTLVRPPTGAFNKAVEATYAKVGLTNLLWDIDVDQGKNLSRDELLKRTEAGVGAVSAAGWKSKTPSSTLVVLLHDIQQNTAGNLGGIIDHIKATVTKVSGGKDSADFGAP